MELNINKMRNNIRSQSLSQSRTHSQSSKNICVNFNQYNKVNQDSLYSSRLRIIQDKKNTNDSPELKIVKTLFSPFHKSNKPFNSKHECKQNIKINDGNQKHVSSEFLKPFGPMIVTHKEKREKVKAPPKKYKFKEEPIKKFDFFDKQKNYKEAKLWNRDTQHPILLRHYNKEFDENTYNRLDSKRYWTIK
jgi:hypothetical protein